ncbi:MAG: ABC transporter ATP-binding protein [Tetrasphaera sp.]|nr:ABC transporter ATP-binding protein [Tetrasphaera sp.]
MSLRIDGLWKSFGTGDAEVQALRGVDLVVDHVQRVALMGASGSGKSTLLHLVGGLDAASNGSIRVRDVEVVGLRGRALVDHRRRVGFVFQAFNLMPGLSALENVELPLMPYLARGGARAKARELLAEVGLADRCDALPGQLSGGQQQRIAVARALIGDPALILADEPTGNLDSETADAVLSLIAHVAQARGATVLIATHDPGIASRCDRVVSLRDGVVVSDTATAESVPGQ